MNASATPFVPAAESTKSQASDAPAGEGGEAPEGEKQDTPESGANASGASGEGQPVGDAKDESAKEDPLKDGTLPARRGPTPEFMPTGYGADAQEVETGGLSGTALWRPQYTGRIRSFSDQKGFGFIDCADTLRAFGRDVFLHRLQVAESNLRVGQTVMFEVELNKAGQPQARNVILCPEGIDPNTWDPSAYDPMGGMTGGWGYNYGYDASYGGYDQWYGGGQNDWYGGGQGGYNSGCGGKCGTKGGGGGKGSWTGDVSAQNRGDGAAQGEQIEEMLRSCQGSQDMWEIIEQYGHSFGRRHVVAALYQLGLFRQYERRAPQASLTSALVDRLVLFPPDKLTAEESSKVLWALAMLDEVRTHSNAHAFAVSLGKEAAKRFSDYSPSQMATLASSLSRLVKGQEEDEIVGKIMTNFSDYALGTGGLPRFPPEELRQWTNFLQEAANQNASGNAAKQQSMIAPNPMQPQGQPPQANYMYNMQGPGAGMANMMGSGGDAPYNSSMMAAAAAAMQPWGMQGGPNMGMGMGMEKGGCPMGPGSPFGNKGGCSPDGSKGMGFDKGDMMMKGKGVGMEGPGKGFPNQGMPMGCGSMPMGPGPNQGMGPGGKPCGGKPGGGLMPSMPGPMGGADPMKGMPPGKGMPGGVPPGKGGMMDGKGMEGKMGMEAKGMMEKGKIPEGMIDKGKGKPGLLPGQAGAMPMPGMMPGAPQGGKPMPDGAKGPGLMPGFPGKGPGPQGMSAPGMKGDMMKGDMKGPDGKGEFKGDMMMKGGMPADMMKGMMMKGDMKGGEMKGEMMKGPGMKGPPNMPGMAGKEGKPPLIPALGKEGKPPLIPGGKADA